MTRPRPRVVVFDVVPTLLDLAPLRSEIAALFGSADPFGEWFARTLHGTLVADHLRRHRPFDLIAAEVLVTTAALRGLALDPDRAAAALGTLRRLPTHPDVPAALDTLAGAGFRLAVLTNGSPDLVTAQMAASGLAGRFEALISVDEIGRFKPAPEVYVQAAFRLSVEIDEMLVVAAHDWDVAGARSVGAGAAFLARPGTVWGLPEPPPDLVTGDLAGLAAVLVEEQPAPGPGSPPG
jgi:2-haloacid dehalogenase